MYLRIDKINEDLKRIDTIINIDTISFDPELDCCEIYTNSNKLFYIPMNKYQYSILMRYIKTNGYYDSDFCAIDATNVEIESINDMIQLAKKINSEEA